SGPPSAGDGSLEDEARWREADWAVVAANCGTCWPRSARLEDAAGPGEQDARAGASALRSRDSDNPAQGGEQAAVRRGAFPDAAPPADGRPAAALRDGREQTDAECSGVHPVEFSRSELPDAGLPGAARVVLESRYGRSWPGAARTVRVAELDCGSPPRDDSRWPPAVAPWRLSPLRQHWFSPAGPGQYGSPGLPQSGEHRPGRDSSRPDARSRTSRVRQP